MDNRSREYEEQKLRDTVDFAAKRAEITAVELDEMEAHINDMLAGYNKDNTDLFSRMVVAEDMRKSLADLLGRCRRAVSSPYFGRVDFTEPEAERELYIGRGGLYDDEAGAPVVIDWRTPIANLYYDGELGDAAYESQGVVYPGKMTLKRTYSISGGRLNEYYDTDMVTNDELLQEYLAKNADAVLRDIVATIQKDQNEIIRIEPWYDVIVQGVAGSGKTTVAMHRLAYLIFNFAGEIKPEQYVVIGTNRMFLSYVSGMLPDLGVESVAQKVMPELLAELLDYKEPVAPLDKKTAPRRSSLAFFEALRQYMDALERDILRHELTLGGKTLMGLQEIDERILGGVKKSLSARGELLNGFLSERITRALPVLEADMEGRFEAELAAFRAGKPCAYGSVADIIDAKHAALKSLAAEAKALKNVYMKKIKVLKEQRVYGEFLAAQGLHSSKNRDVYDLAALCYIAFRLRTIKSPIRHIIVDEAQDFGPALYMCLTELFPEATFTVLGDVLQNIGDGVGVTDWDEVLESAFAQRRCKFRVLAKSYRNTVEIAEAANRVATKSGVAKYEAVPVVRHGDPVVFDVFKTAAELEDAAVAEAEAWQGGSLALVCPTEAAARKLAARLPQAGLILASDGEARYEGGVTVFDADSVKGLEFDRVVVCGASSRDYSPDSPRHIRLLYVVLTRALHQLRVLTVKDGGGLLE